MPRRDLLPILRFISFAYLGACGPDTNEVLLELAPDVVSSLDGTLAIHAIALADRDPVPGEHIAITVDYRDRHGVAHVIAQAEGVSDETGALDVVLDGLMWDGLGTVKAQILSGGAGSPALLRGSEPVEAVASFSVLDRTPPVVMIVPPPASQVRAGNGVSIMVRVTDEIGVSRVFFESSSDSNDSTVVTGGSANTSVAFDLDVPGSAAIGSTITVYALAADLSSNEAAATPIVLTVVP